MNDESAPAQRRANRLPLLLVGVVAVACLAPFVNKAFHMDDPLFVWAARQIQHHPADFYGFKVNWYSSEMPMAEVTKNPPLCSYYLALAGSIFGWSEVSLHLAMLLAAVAVAIGTYFLAQEMGTNPSLSALATILTPVFLVSSTNVMCDTLMLAFWVWAVFFWMRGMAHRSDLLCAIAAILVGLSALTKYFGVSLIPLLLIYSWVRARRPGRRAFYLLIPVVLMAAYQWLTFKLYGRGLLSDAVAYATLPETRTGAQVVSRVVVGLAFLGGCVVPTFFYAPLLWSKRTLALIGILAIGVGSLLLVLKMSGPFQIRGPDGFRWGLLAQMVMFAAGGISLLWLAGSDLHRRRDPGSLLLFLWLLGTLIFAAVVNWTVNGRSLLPLAPAAAILLARRLEERFKAISLRDWRFTVPLALGGFVALAVARADLQFANNARLAANLIHARYGAAASGPVWFQGHWGFQYYMEQLGAKPIELANTTFVPGDIAVMPSIGSNMYDLYDLGDAVTAIEKMIAAGGRWVTTLNTGMGSDAVGAGFYSDVLGPAPYVFGPLPPEFFMVYKVNRTTGYRRVTQADREAATQLLGAGNALLRQGKLSEAITNLTEAVSRLPNLIEARLLLGRALMQQQKPAAAATNFTTILRFHPDVPEAHYQLGTILAARHELTEAVGHFQEAVRLKPDWVEALNNLAWILATSPDDKIRNGAEAVRHATRGVELTASQNPGVLDTLAAAYAEAGKFSDAVEAARKAEQLAAAANQKEVAAEIEKHRQAYANGKPHRE